MRLFLIKFKTLLTCLSGFIDNFFFVLSVVGHLVLPFIFYTLLVAETGLAPVPRGYEPLEVLLLHSAIYWISYTLLYACYNFVLLNETNTNIRMYSLWDPYPYFPIGTPDRICTYDLPHIRRVLCWLSYKCIFGSDSCSSPPTKQLGTFNL